MFVLFLLLSSSVLKTESYSVPMVFSVSHKTVSLSKINPSLDGDSLSSRVVSFPSTIEAAVVSTCNRFEIYVSSKNESSTLLEMEPLLKETLPLVSKEEWNTLSGREAVQHVMRVVVGLESVLVGEKQISTQFRKSLSTYRYREEEEREEEEETGKSRKLLYRLYTDALSLGKKYRKQKEEDSPSVGRWGVSVSRRCPLLPVAVIGAGHLAENVLHNLGGDTDVILVNRNRTRADFLARKFDNVVRDVLPEEEMASVFGKVSVVFVCAPVKISCDMLRSSLSEEEEWKSPPMIVDLSLPVSIDPECSSLTTVYTLEDIVKIHDTIDNPPLVQDQIDRYSLWAGLPTPR